MAAIIEQRRATIQRGKAMLAELKPERTFEALITGKEKGPPVQLDLFGPPKPRKPRAPRYRPYPAAREREQRALQLRRAGATRREIAEELSVTPRAVSRYFNKWRREGALPPVSIGRPPA